MQLTVPVTLSRDGFACLPVGNNKNKKTQKLKNTKTQKLKNSKKNSTSFPKNSHFFLLPSFSPLSFFLKLDWIDSPFIGQGHAPNGTTKVYISVYLDRLIALNEQRYTFAISLYFFLSWVDPRAPGAVAAATEAADRPGSDPDSQCRRSCSGQHMAVPGEPCCDGMWLPSVLVRNVEEFPQGRTQPYSIEVSPEGVVTWRVEVRGDMYTTLDVRAFPFDSQTLDIHMQYINNDPEVSQIEFVSSSRGLKLFTIGSGDDLSGFEAKNIYIFTTTEPFPLQFDDPLVHNQVVARSARGDPAPIVPAKGQNQSLAFGNNKMITDITVAIVVKRISLYYVLGMIVPILLLAGLAILTLFIDPRLIETRLTSILSLYLANVALLFVFESDLPRSSYVLPLRQLALLSHILLFALALETIIVYNIESLSDIRAHFSSMRAASTARARLSERKADTKRERQRLLLLAAASRDAGGEPATPSSSSNNNGARAPPGRRLPGALLSWGSMEISAIRRPWASRSAPSASLEASRPRASRRWRRSPKKREWEATAGATARTAVAPRAASEAAKAASKPPLPTVRNPQPQQQREQPLTKPPPMPRNSPAPPPSAKRQSASRPSTRRSREATTPGSPGASTSRAPLFSASPTCSPRC